MQLTEHKDATSISNRINITYGTCNEKDFNVYVKTCIQPSFLEEHRQYKMPISGYATMGLGMIYQYTLGGKVLTDIECLRFADIIELATQLNNGNTVHGDIKPGNIIMETMLANVARLYIIDCNDGTNICDVMYVVMYIQQGIIILW